MLRWCCSVDCGGGMLVAGTGMGTSGGTGVGAMTAPVATETIGVVVCIGGGGVMGGGAEVSGGGG